MGFIKTKNKTPTTLYKKNLIHTRNFEFIGGRIAGGNAGLQR